MSFGMGLGEMHGHHGRGNAGYTMTSVTFPSTAFGPGDGQLEQVASIGDSGSLTIVQWARIRDANLSNIPDTFEILSGSAGSFFGRLRTDQVNNSMDSLFRNGGQTISYSTISQHNVVAVQTWYCFMFSANMNLSAGNKIFNLYMATAGGDAVAIPAVSTIDAGAAFLIPINGKLFTLFESSSAWDAADTWVDPSFIDFTVTANRRKFINSDGTPVFLGNNGGNPTGSSPWAFFSGSAATYATNKGTGGGWTLTGPIQDNNTNPPP